MEEENKPIEQPTQEQPTQPQEPTQTQAPTQTQEPTDSIIDQAKQLKADNQKLLEEMKKENTRAEKIQADSILAGKSTSASPPEEKSDHQKYIERTKAKYKGSGRDPTKGYERQF